MDTSEIVRHSWGLFGRVVTIDFVATFERKYGRSHPSTIAAQATLLDLLSKPSQMPPELIESPSEASRVLFANAPVSIPNSRSSSEPRKKGRSID